MKKKCLIVAGGAIDLQFAEEFLKTRNYDMIVAVDSGLEALKALNRIPDQIVGDLDSVDPAVLKEFVALDGISVDAHRPDKDETDTELALMAAAKSGCDGVDLIGALGGRMDHAICNIQLIYQFYLQGMSVCVYDEKNCLYLLGSGKLFHKDELYGRYISFLPMTEIVEGLTLKGFKYPLNHRRIELGSGLCISNELNGSTGIMDLDHGILLCVESHD